jgi:hypothetical protein
MTAQTDDRQRVTAATNRVLVPLGPARVDITGVRAGDRNAFTLTLSRNAVPFDLTGLEVTAQARRRATDPDPPALIADVQVANPTAGQLVIAWPGEQVAALFPEGSAPDAWVGVWDLQVADNVNDPLTVAAGTLAAVPDVTRP